MNLCYYHKLLQHRVCYTACPEKKFLVPSTTLLWDSHSKLHYYLVERQYGIWWSQTHYKGMHIIKNHTFNSAHFIICLYLRERTNIVTYLTDTLLVNHIYYKWFWGFMFVLIQSLLLFGKHAQVTLKKRSFFLCQQTLTLETHITE